MSSLEELKKKYAELGCEIGRLEQKPKTGKVLRVGDLKFGDKYYVAMPHETCCCVFYGDLVDQQNINFGNAFYGKESAITYREAKLLAHECDIAIAESWDGEEIDWNDESQVKHYLIVFQGNLETSENYVTFRRFPFKATKDAQAFIDKHGKQAVINMIRNY